MRLLFAENIESLYRTAVVVSILSLAVGCSKDSSLSVLSGDVITFEAPIFKDEVADTTRGAIVSAFASGDSFGVFAYHNDNLAESTTTIMSNQMVTKGSDGSWSYSPTQYWDVAPTSLYDFYAYSPHESTALTFAYNETTNKPQLTYAPSTDVSKQEDLLFAEPLTDLTSQDGDVKFDFNHALTAISFEAKCFDTSVTGKLYKIELTDINTSATADIDGKTIVWAYPETPTTADYTAAITFDIDEIIENEETDEIVTTYETYRTIASTIATTDLTPSDNVLLLLPQTLTSDARLVATLTVNGVDNVDVSFSFPTGSVWSPSTKVTYTIIFGTEVTVSYTVQEWSVDSVLDTDTIGDLIYEGTINADDEDWNTTTDTDQNIGDLSVDSDKIDSDSGTDWVEQEDVDNTSGGETDYDSLATDDNEWSDNTTTNDDSIGDTSIDGTVDSSVQNDWDESYTDSATIGGTTTED